MGLIEPASADQQAIDSAYATVRGLALEVLAAALRGWIGTMRPVWANPSGLTPNAVLAGFTQKGQDVPTLFARSQMLLTFCRQVIAAEGLTQSQVLQIAGGDTTGVDFGALFDTTLTGIPGGWTVDANFNPVPPPAPTPAPTDPTPTA